MRYYADSCIWIDFLEDRYKIDIFYDCLNNKEELLISDILIDELNKYIRLEHMKMILMMFDSKNLLCKVISSLEQGVEAKKIALERDIPRGGVLHAIIARDCNATLISRDKHFLQLRDICKVELL